MKSTVILFSCLLVLVESGYSGGYCPQSCTCLTGTLFYVGCAGRGLVSIEHIPTQAQWLRLSNNSIPALYNSHFKDLSLVQVRTLELDGNSINYIGRHAFRDMDSLSYLNLSSNRIRYVYPYTFNSTVNLVKLDLSFNPLDALHHPFLIAPYIKDLALQSCNLSYIAAGAFRGMPSLTQLDLSNNHIVTFEPLTFTRLPYLNRIVANRNELECGAANDLMRQLVQSHINITGINCHDLEFNVTSNEERTSHHESSVNIVPNQIEIKNKTITFIKIHRKFVIGGKETKGTELESDGEFEVKDSGENLDPNREFDVIPPVRTTSFNNTPAVSKSEETIHSDMLQTVALGTFVLMCVILVCTCVALCRRCVTCCRRRNSTQLRHHQASRTFKGPTAPNHLDVDLETPPPSYYQVFKLSLDR